MNIKSKINYYKTNIPLVTKRFLRYKTLDMFDAVEIETNTECNRKCVNCPNFLFEREKGLMETNLYKKIINELSETKYNGRLSPHFYNEPLLDKRLLLLMSYTRDKLPEAFICVYTNGDLLDRKLFDELIEAGVDNFFITQYDEELSNSLRELMNSLDEKEKKKLTVRVFGDKETFKFNRGGILKINSNKFSSCSYPSTTLVIDWKGRVLLCCNDYFSEHIFGDLKTEKLMNIWKKEHFHQTRKEIKRGIFNRDICRSCSGMEEKK